ncbi:N-acetylglucosamine-specific PTS transporter subunit IIBC [Planococcus sp. CP5-4]|uniref:N-acetylglucosamine-specific PTS transporter subunit IIBC n=1 Tax=unclassified Planococcus (in: firmicutes) TaxID=2662419 RepID=UPI001C245F50|nr:MULTISPECIES: N-acetylglucosamine-specific PTS transporter subunit IIBC [unclassified Planococcus (in: firmicutes)]MBU9673802.1 N-acetylglucosamine-specific PTS transporter subunit IIBC [Planococcus sp. CP5-4_YE]MBV0908930.1 N-acetylglucosamine-specific PTS transporter subunit IIBC [Planococcus sp. CP5-4_UN]MBW6063979.1 N-acetylglucosamine-specific PTS transporter subunit IIBC [Planococcus sp. CP5-4]
MFGFLQKIGKSLMFPIATLPAAALLLRFGQDDLLGIPFLSAAGAGIIDNLAIIFAIGIAMGLAHDGNGGAALAGAIAYLVLTSAIVTINESINMGVFAGILSGIVGGLLYNKFYDVKLPSWLAFFGGRRFVPIITAATMTIIAGALGYLWPPVQEGIDAAGAWILNAGMFGVGSYGFLNRLLLPTGLHHVINTVVWFDFGTFTDANGEVIRGEINRFLKGDPTAGPFLSGFFPVMMFGLPAACLAMYMAAKKERKAAVGGMLFSIGFTSFLTGITEPIEFSFMFLSPILYVIHALLTGVSMMVAYALDIRHGFGFSAGAIDYVLNYGLAENPLLLLVMGLITGIVYFTVFYFMIIKFDLKTPGREDEDAEDGNAYSGDDKIDVRAYQTIEALGGSNNLTSVDYCTTRLRVTVKDAGEVNEKDLKRQGAMGVMKVNKTNVQVVIGTAVEFLGDAMKKRLADGNPAPENTDQVLEDAPAGQEMTKEILAEDFVMPIEGEIVPLSEVPDDAFAKEMMGPGFGIKPSSSIVYSPVDGRLVTVFPTKHALGIETDTGVEILIHVGLDTVKLNGEGFESLVEQGQLVQRGDALLKLDLAFLEANAPSIVTPIVFTNLSGQKLDMLKNGFQQQGTASILKIK